METWSLEKELHRLEKLLRSHILDFSATYMAVQSLHAFIQDHPQMIRPSSVSSLKHVLKDNTYASQTLSLFLYKEAADALISIVTLTSRGCLTELSIQALRKIVGTTRFSS